METIRINCEPNIKTKIVEFLNNFSSNDYKIINEDTAFRNEKMKLEATLEKIANGSAKFYTVEEANDYIEKTNFQNED